MSRWRRVINEVFGGKANISGRTLVGNTATTGTVGDFLVLGTGTTSVIYICTTAGTGAGWVVIQ